ncbi:MAG: PAS domain-containing protein, partial [Burkholderiales bacterium]|nr:PAS domain-containing protein [Burkholderiales bacterium]
MPDARQRRERLLLVAVLLAGALWLGWERWASHDAVGRAERAHLAAQARALEENLRPQLVAAYLTLRRLQAALALLPPAQWGPSLAPRLAPLSEALAGVRSIEITDAAGRRVAGGGDPGAPTAAQALPSLGPRPSPAVLYLDAVPGPGPTTALLTLAVLDAQGRRVGAVSAALDPAYFGALLSSVLDAADMQAAIVQGPGRLLAWQAADAASGLQPAPGDGAWMAQRLPDAGGTPGASVLAVAGRPPRLLAQRILQARGLPLAQPLVLLVSRDLQALYAPWWHRTAIYVALYLLLAGAALAAGLRLQRRQAEMRQLSQATQREREIDAERLALALRGGDLALWDLSLPSGQTVVNDRWFSMLGLVRGDVEPGVEGWLSLLHPDDRAAARAAQDAHLAGATPAYEASYRMRHRDGRWRWVLDRG